MNIYVIAASLISCLVIAGYLWYSIRSSGFQDAKDQDAAAQLGAAGKLKDAKIKSLDDRIIDSEYRQRIEDKKNAAKTTTADDAKRMLEDALRDDPSKPN